MPRRKRYDRVHISYLRHVCQCCIRTKTLSANGDPLSAGLPQGVNGCFDLLQGIPVWLIVQAFTRPRHLQKNYPTLRTELFYYRFQVWGLRHTPFTMHQNYPARWLRRHCGMRREYQGE